MGSYGELWGDMGSYGEIVHLTEEILHPRSIEAAVEATTWRACGDVTAPHMLEVREGGDVGIGGEEHLTLV